MKALKTLMVLAVALMAAFCIVPSEVDAEVFVNSPNDTIHFNTMNGGSISLDVENDGSAVDATVRIVESDGDEIYNKNHLIPTGESTLKLNLYDYKSEGTHSLTIYFEPADKFTMDSMNLEIVVDKHILSNWTTYVVIIFVVIVIAILVYMKIRDSPSKSKNTMTFEELEALEKAEKSERKSKRAPEVAPSTERKKYTGKK